MGRIFPCLFTLPVIWEILFLSWPSNPNLNLSLWIRELSSGIYTTFPGRLPSPRRACCYFKLWGGERSFRHESSCPFPYPSSPLRYLFFSLQPLFQCAANKYHTSKIERFVSLSLCFLPYSLITTCHNPPCDSGVDRVCRALKRGICGKRDKYNQHQLELLLS